MRDIKNDNFSLRYDPRLWKRIFSFFSPVKRPLCAAVAALTVSAGTDAAIPVFTSYAVNKFVLTRTVEGLAAFTAVYTAAILLQSAAAVLMTRLCMVIEMKMGREMKRAAFLHLQKLSISFYNSTSVGYILARVMSDTDRISGMIAWGFVHFAWHVFFVCAIFVYMLILDARLAFIMLATLPVMLVVTQFFQPRLLRAHSEMRRANSAITSSFNENINGACTAKTLVIEDKSCAEFNGITSAMYSASLRSSMLNAVYVPIVTFIGAAAVAFVLNFGGVMAASRMLSLGVLSAFVSYAISLMGAIAEISEMFSDFLSAQVNIGRVIDLLDEPERVTDRTDVVEKYGDVLSPKADNYPRIKGNVEFDHVWFRYPDAEPDDYVLRDVCLKVPAGATVALVGRTGAGKSTMVNLVCRFFEPSRGRILIDGADYRELSQNWLHSQLGYVQQSPHLFSGTIADNIRYGRLDASDEDIERAASLACVDKVAARLPEGYETDVGEGGGRLSTGEKQLVSFARAIIANPPIFVLDEATSSIDTETEQLIQDAISHVLTGRTSFIIAHRLSTVRSADVILVVDGGGITERGTHDELMAENGEYRRLYERMRLGES